MLYSQTKKKESPRTLKKLLLNGKYFKSDRRMFTYKHSMWHDTIEKMCSFLRQWIGGWARVRSFWSLNVPVAQIHKNKIK